MNILLVNPPIRESIPPYFHPIGLASVAAVLRHGGHDVSILDLNMLRPHDVPAALPKGAFDWIGVSGIITTFGYLTKLVPLLRKTYGAPIVIGGGGMTSAPEVYMDTIRPDYGVIGEGEYTSLDVCKVISGEMAPKDCLGLVYFDDGIKLSPPRPLEKTLDNFPLPAYDLLDMHGYARNVRHNMKAKRELAMLATRGCPWHCAFCYHIFGRGVRYRHPKNVVDEMESHLKNYGATSFLFGDECITAKKSWMVQFCNEILGRNLEVEWMCYTRADSLDEETMILMAGAGCFRVGYGIESGSQRILDEMGKGIKLETVKASFLKAKKHFREVGVTLIFGMPGENDETVAETTEFLKDLKGYVPFFHLTAYPGTRVFEENKDKILAKYGTLANFFCALGDAGMFSVNLTNWTDDEYLVKKFNMQRRIKEHLMILGAWDDYRKDIRREATAMNGDYPRLYRLLGGEA